MSTDSPRIAKTVVYRHPCDCDHASRPLEPGEHAEHRFDVDGQPFPWHIAEEGATFNQIAPGLVAVTVRLMPFVRSTNELLNVVLGTLDAQQPLAFQHVDGTIRPFPWLTLTDSFSVTYGDFLPIVSLSFVAEHVDTDGEIQDGDQGDTEASK